MTTDALEGLGAVELASGGANLRSLSPGCAADLAARVFPADRFAFRLALTEKLGADPAERLRAITAAGGGARLAEELNRLAGVLPHLGGLLRLRAAGAASLLASAPPRSAGALAASESTSADPAALARWATLPFQRAQRAYLRLLAERPELAGPLVGSWNPNEVLAASARWPADARARLVSLAGV